MQLLLTGFLEKKTGAFVTELWELLLSAMEVGRSVALAALAGSALAAEFAARRRS